MAIRNKKHAAQNLNYIIEKIERMTTGNLVHHRNAIEANLKELKVYLERS